MLDMKNLTIIFTTTGKFHCKFYREIAVGSIVFVAALPRYGFSSVSLQRQVQPCCVNFIHYFPR